MSYPNYVRTLIAATALFLAALPVAAQDPPPLVEADLLATLQSSTEYTARMQAFRGLRQVGTEASIPVIAGFLHNPTDSHLARYALESMPYPEAVAALRGALEGAPVEVLPGLLTSLGARRDADAVSLITPLVTHENADVARAAAAALGRIASPAAVSDLLAAHNAAGAKRTDIAEALLAAGQQLTADKSRKEAAAIYQALQGPENPEFVRVGAFYGLAKATPGKTPERILQALQGDDPLYRNLAREVVAETKGEKGTAKYLAALPQLPDDAKIMLLAGLARRGDPSAREAVLALAVAENTEVQAAAVDALGALGNAADVPQLASLLLDADAPVAAAARNGLIRLKDPAVNAAIAQTLPLVEPATRAQLLELLAVRIAPESVPEATKALGDSAGEVRLAALRVLQQQGTVAELEPVINLMKSTQSAEETDLGARTLGSIAAGARNEALPAILAHLPEAPPAVKVALVEALGKIGGADALTPVAALLDGGDDALQKTALKVLEEWPSQDAAPVLLELAKSEDAARHDAGLKGYTRLAQAHPEHDPKNAMMAEAMGLARSKEDKWLVLSAYGTVFTGPSMDALESQLDDPDVRKEAGMALVKVAEEVSKHGDDGKARAKKSLELIKAKAPSDLVVQQADKLLQRLQ